MFYFSEEPNCRKNKQVVSGLGRRSNISGSPTYQTSDLQRACQGPGRRPRGLETPEAPALPPPTPQPHRRIPLFRTGRRALTGGTGKPVRPQRSPSGPGETRRREREAWSQGAGGSFQKNVSSSPRKTSRQLLPPGGLPPGSLPPSFQRQRAASGKRGWVPGQVSKICLPDYGFC